MPEELNTTSPVANLLRSQHGIDEMDTVGPTISAYQYCPLNNKPDRQFRLIKVIEISSTSQVIGTMQIGLLEYITNGSYLALSYTWGASTPKRIILIDGKEHKAGQNLYDFLHAYGTCRWGREGNSRWLSIDQICIDQSHLAERSQQVSIMNQIFKRSSGVLVWFGCDPAMIDAARRVKEYKTSEEHSLAAVLRNPYYARVWIVQEVSLTTSFNTTIVCGNVQMSWKCLLDVIPDTYHYRGAGVPAGAVKVILEYSQHFRTLEHCIASYCSNGCQDPQDKVYGTLGLTPEKWRVQVDYGKTVIKVFCDTLIALIEEVLDLLDPQCYYPVTSLDESSCCCAILALARAMGLPEHQVKGLNPDCNRQHKTRARLQHKLSSSPNSAMTQRHDSVYPASNHGPTAKPLAFEITHDIKAKSITGGVGEQSGQIAFDFNENSNYRRVLQYSGIGKQLA